MQLCSADFKTILFDPLLELAPRETGTWNVMFYNGILTRTVAYAIVRKFIITKRSDSKKIIDGYKYFEIILLY